MNSILGKFGLRLGKVGNQPFPNANRTFTTPNRLSAKFEPTVVRTVLSILVKVGLVLGTVGLVLAKGWSDTGKVALIQGMSRGREGKERMRLGGIMILLTVPPIPILIE